MAETTPVARTTKQQSILAFNNIVNGGWMQNQLKKVYGSYAGTFSTSLIELYSSNSDLQECNPKDVAMEALKAASLHLPVSKALKRCYVVAFKDHGVKKPTMIVSWQGLVDLAQRSGFYRTINPGVIYKGELVGVDKLTGFIDLSGEKESDEIIGYFGFFELINGFKKVYYSSLEDMCKYAIHYSPTFRNKPPKVETLMEIAQRQATSGPTGIGWYGNFDSMAKKTCLRQVLNFGPMSVEMQTALQNDPDFDSTGMAERDEANSEDKKEIDAQAILQEAQAEEVKDSDDLGELE